MMMIVKISRPLHRIVSVDNFCNYSAMLGLRVFEIVDLGHDYDLIKFSCAEDCNYVLTGDLCIFFYHYVTMREWLPNFNLIITFIDLVATYVHLLELEVEYYDRKSL